MIALFRQWVPDEATRSLIAEIGRESLHFAEAALWFGVVWFAARVIKRCATHTPRTGVVVGMGLVIFLMWATAIWGDWMGDVYQCWHHEWTQAECDAMGYE